MSLDPEEKTNLLRERIALSRLLEERLVIEQITTLGVDLEEIKREIKTGRITVTPEFSSPSKSSYSGSKVIEDQLKQKTKQRKIKVESSPQVINALNEMQELRTLINKPFSDIYKQELSNVSKNKFVPIRKLREFLETQDFNANELALLTKLVKQIVKYNKGSIERVLTALFIESEISRKYQVP